MLFDVRLCRLKGYPHTIEADFSSMDVVPVGEN